MKIIGGIVQVWWYRLSKFWVLAHHLLLLPLFYANRVDPDQTPRSAASDPGLHCLAMPLKWDTSHILVNIFSFQLFARVMGGLYFTVTKAILWLSINVLVIFAQKPTKICTEHSRIHKQGVCGASIHKVLSALCGKEGYVEKMYKRAESPPIDDSSIGGIAGNTLLCL